MSLAKFTEDCTKERDCEGGQAVCICPACINEYLSAFAEAKSVTLLAPSGDINEPTRDIDQRLHENLHILWIGHFVQLFSPLFQRTGLLWYLRPLDDDDKTLCPPIWRTTIKAKVRFNCDSCQHIWTSMLGTAIFSVHHSSSIPNALELCFNLLGQKCSECDSKVFQPAIWYPEEVVRVLNYIHWQICDELLMLNGATHMTTLIAAGQLKLQQNPPPVNPISRSRRTLRVVQRVCRSVTFVGGRNNPAGHGQPMKSHDSEHCEACQKGICLTKCGPNAGQLEHQGRLSSVKERKNAPTRRFVAKKDKFTSITPEKVKQVSKTSKKSQKSSEIQRSMLTLCFKVSTKRTTFGSILPANKRDVIIFRSLRCTSNAEDCKLIVESKEWKSCGNLVELVETLEEIELEDK